MKLKVWLTVTLAAGLFATNSFAYEVWTGTHNFPVEILTNKPSWSHTAAQIQGLNIIGTLSKSDWIKVFSQFTGVSNNFVPCPRSAPSRNLTHTNEFLFNDLTNWVNTQLSLAVDRTYTLQNIMIYGNNIDTNSYNWTTMEVQQLRNILNGKGRADIGLIWDARTANTGDKKWATNSLINHVLIEGSANDIYFNSNGKRDMAAWLWTNPVTTNKKIIFQMPRSENALPQYQATREAVQRLCTLPPPLGTNFMRSSRVVFLPCNYNLGDSGQFTFAPETVPGNGALYTNTLSGLCLSLIEQRDLFEGRLANLPTLADADSYVRNSPPDVSDVSDQQLNLNETTGALPFIVDDEQQTPAGSLTVTRESSNLVLVPLANVVLGGSGSNRTVTVTPAAGQTGSTTISLMVNDGLYATTNTFTVTVLNSLSGTLPGTTNDAGITENLVIEHPVDANADVGCRGNSPYVERCVVYVFQLPSWGAVNNPFLSASFAFNFVNKNVSSIRNYDLYGLGRRASATVLTNDYYATNAVADPTDATRLQTSVLTSATPLGLVTTSTAGDANLLAYLNDQYAAGAGAGQYVFLRINTTSVKIGSSYVTVTMSEGGVATPTDTRPRIDFTAVMPNTAPTLATVSNLTVIAGQTVTITNVATDADVPAQELTFSLLNPPIGAVINAHSGVFTWQPTIAQSPSTNTIKVRVADNAPASLSATNSFKVTVIRPVTPGLSVPAWSGDGFSFTISGDNGPDYLILSSTNLVDWQPVGTDDGAPPPFTFTDVDTNNFNQRFYRVILGP